MSYRRAWLLVEESTTVYMNRPSQRHQVVRGAVVTAVGARIIDLYHCIESQAISAPDTNSAHLERWLGAKQASA
jgi:molybdenum-dependent DNA-binding transcriptional regulator ModE